MVRGEKVAIFGDYDVDGASSAALLARFLRLGGLDPLIHIPDRIFEGYGPNVEAIRSLAGGGATLLVTVDCGTTSHRAAGGSRSGWASTPSSSIITRPTRRCRRRSRWSIPTGSTISPQLGHLAAVGLVFMMVVAVNRELRARGFWTAARPRARSARPRSISWRSAPSPTWCRSRASTAPSSPRGCSALRRRDNVGLTALMDVARLGGPPEPWHLGFLLGPRINAGGRIGRADARRSICCCATIRSRPRGSPPSSTGSTASARRSRSPRVAAGRGRGDGGARPRGTRRGGGHGRAGLASGRGRAGRGAAQGALRPARPSRSRSGRAASAPARAARSPASISAARCARR